MYANTNTNLSLDSSPSTWESALSWDNTNLPHPPRRYWTVFLSCSFFLSLNLHLEFICFENLQPIVCIAAYVRLVGAVQSFKGDMGTKDFKIGVAVRQGMVPLIAYYVVCDTWGVTIQAAPELLLLSQRCVVFVGVHPDRTVLENSYSICWVCTNLSLGDGQISDNKSPPAWPENLCLQHLVADSG